MSGFHVHPLLLPIVNKNLNQKVYTPSGLFIKSFDLVMGLSRLCGKNYNEASLERMINPSSTAPIIRIIATSLDGKVVEAIEHTIYPNVLGVQLHPDARLPQAPHEGKALKIVTDLDMNLGG